MTVRRLLAVTVFFVAAALGVTRSGGSGTGSDGMVVADLLEQGGVLAGTGCYGRGCGDEPLERWVMAVWVSRAAGLTPEQSAAGLRFSDVGPDIWWAPYVELLADVGVVSGCGSSPARFCPTDALTRGQMATILVRAFGLPPAGPSEFVDIEGSVHAPSIDALTASGIGTGCGTQLRFCPDRLVTRDGGAALVHQAMLQHEYPFSGRGWVSYDLPGGEMVEAANGKPRGLRSLVDGSRPLLLWFWSPW